MIAQKTRGCYAQKHMTTCADQRLRLPTQNRVSGRLVLTQPRHALFAKPHACLMPHTAYVKLTPYARTMATGAGQVPSPYSPRQYPHAHNCHHHCNRNSQQPHQRRLSLVGTWLGRIITQHKTKYASSVMPDQVKQHLRA